MANIIVARRKMEMNLRIFKYITSVCLIVYRTWAACRTTISFVLDLWEMCTGEKRKDVIHSLFGRCDEIQQAGLKGTEVENFRKILLAIVKQEEPEARRWIEVNVAVK